MGNSHKPHKMRHHSKKRGGANEENTENVDVGEMDVGEMEMEEPAKPVAVKKPVSVAAKPVANAPVANANAPVANANAPVDKAKCCPCPDENEGLLKKLSPKKGLDNLEAGILNTHALVGKFRTDKTAELKEDLKGKVLGLTSKINETVGNKAAAPAPAVEEEAQAGGRRRRRRTSKVKKGRKSKKRSKSKKGRKTKRTRKTKRY
jgi:hypothetical protein